MNPMIPWANGSLYECVHLPGIDGFLILISSESKILRLPPYKLPTFPQEPNPALYSLLQWLLSQRHKSSQAPGGFLGQDGIWYDLRDRQMASDIALHFCWGSQSRRRGWKLKQVLCGIEERNFTVLTFLNKRHCYYSVARNEGRPHQKIGRSQFPNS